MTEDPENAISDDLKTPNFKYFPARRQQWWRLVGVGPPNFYKLPTPLDSATCKLQAFATKCLEYLSIFL